MGLYEIGWPIKACHVTVLVADLKPFKGACQPPPSPLHDISDRSSILLLFLLIHPFSFPFFKSSISQFFRILSVPFSKFSRPSLSFFFSFLTSAFCPSISFCRDIINSLGRGYSSRTRRSLPFSIQALTFPRGSWPTHWMKTPPFTSGLNLTYPLIFST